MCLILFSYRLHPDYKLIIAANRDEYYKRPTMKAHWRGTSPDILAGKDLHAGGTWMGISETGRFAALTNYRNPADMKEHMKSRGKLVDSFLNDAMTPEVCSETLISTAGEYNGYNLLFGDIDSMYYFSNKSLEFLRLKAGVYGLSNHLLDTDWPKVRRGKELFYDATAGSFAPEDILDILHDSSKPADSELPETGVNIDLERVLSPMFIASPEYGTRSSTVLTVDNDNNVTFTERTYNGGQSHQDNSFRFHIV